MKSISPIKFFTAVGFLVVSMLSLNLIAQAVVTQKTQSEFEAEFCGNEAKNKSNPKWKKTCEDSNFSDCPEAKRKYGDSLLDYNRACEGIKSKGKTCEDRLRSCKENLNDAFKDNGDKPSDEPGILETFTNIYMSRNFPQGATLPNGERNAKPYDPCLEFENDKTISAEDKLSSRIEKLESKKDTYDEKIRDIQEKMTKLEEDKNKAIEESKADNEKIEEDKNKFQKDVNEALQKLDKQKAEKYRQQANELAEAATKIRNLQSALIKKQEEAEARKFDHLQNMKQFAEDKISTQCQTAVETAKACFIKSSKGIMDASDKTCAGVGTFNGKGAKGTAQLKSKIGKMREACFEQANMAVNKAKFQQASTIRAIESDITEKNSQIKDLNEANVRKAEQTKQIDAEFDKEKSTEENNLTKKMDEFAKKVENVTAKVNAKLQKLALDGNRLKLNLEEFNAKKLAADADIEKAKNNPKAFSTPVTQASNVIDKHESNRKSAELACCPPDKKGCEFRKESDSNRPAGPAAKTKTST